MRAALKLGTPSVVREVFAERLLGLFARPSGPDEELCR